MSITEDGVVLLSRKGEKLGELKELCFMADTKHGLALFPGTEQSAVEALVRIRRRCPDDAESLHLLMVGKDVDEIEGNYMLVTRRLPRRVQMRLK